MADDLPDAVIFDVDGTLLETEQHGHRVAFNDAFAARGMDLHWDIPTYRELLAVPGGRARLRHHLLEIGYAEAEADDVSGEVHADKTRRFLAMVHDGRIPARPGAHRLLRELRDADVTIAVATNGSAAWVGPALEAAFPDIHFAHRITSDDVDELKPDPASYLQMLDRLDTDPRRTLVFEDAQKGLEAATAAGLPCIVVVNDDTRDEHFAGARLVVDDFGDDAPVTVLAGPAALLDDGRVTAATCARALA